MELDSVEIAESYDLDEVEHFHKFFPWLDQENFEEHEAMLRAIVLDDDGVWGFDSADVLAAFAEEDVAGADWLARTGWRKKFAVKSLPVLDSKLWK